ncbi:putative peptidase [uncultured phage cr113_1]|uniref:Peptidase n=1 Tax=uncultured phage cr113_1 TaxID=2772087 RepID=A0A7M1RU24_9CAUD|nr:endolysin [uncultured phage cr113_1]QOR57401.1 putative peptidase [uncultured phage cr113_1]
MIYFTLKELTRSSAAEANKLDNTPDELAEKNLNTLVDNVLDPLRELYGKPIRVTSGYRSPAVNRSVNGATSSQHALGEAADISVDSKEENKKLFNLIKDNLPYDLLINEYDYSWVHVSYRNGRLRKLILSIGNNIAYK